MDISPMGECWIYIDYKFAVIKHSLNGKYGPHGCGGHMLEKYVEELAC